MDAMKIQSAVRKVILCLAPMILLSGCLSAETSDGGNGAVTPVPPSTGNSAPTISGSPAASVTVGENYSFSPSASDPDGDTLTFQISNLPGWASFDTSTGALSGVPTLATIGMYPDIRISVSDASTQSSLPQFGVEVLSNEVVTGMAVSGQQPSENSSADVGTVVRVTFTSAVNPGSVSSTSVTVSDRNGSVGGSLTVEGNTIVFTPSNNLDIGMFHSVQVASSVSSTSGESLGTPFSWSFTTSFGDAIPELAALEVTMLDQGPRWGSYMDPAGPNSQSDKFFHEFYGTANTFQRFADYFGTAEPWLTYADWGNEVFRTYLTNTGYTTQGLRRFTHGMYGEFVLDDSVTLQELEMLRDNPAFSRVSEGRGQGGSEHRSRPVALAVVSNIHAERAGSTRRIEGNQARLETFLPWMGSHLYEWRTGDYRGTPDVGVPRFAPFMFALTAHSLITYIEWERELGNDENQYWRTTYPMDYGQGTTAGAQTVTWPTIIDALADVAEWAVLEATHDTSQNITMWQPDNQGYASFYYQTSNSPSLAPGLNLMIAPAYAWLWKETGDRRFRDWADQLFGAGALNSLSAARNNGKLFNQQFFLSFDYIKWRAEGDELWLDQ